MVRESFARRVGIPMPHHQTRSPKFRTGKTTVVKMKLWIDDIREPPDESWCWVKSSEEAMCMFGADVTEISFDHDLGGDDTAMPVVRWIEELAHSGEIARFKWSIHSANPVGRANLEAAMRSADRFWSKWEAELTEDAKSQS